MDPAQNDEREMEGDEVIGIAGPGGFLIPAGHVDAVCRSVKRVHFRMFNRVKLVFAFEVFSPAEFQGVTLNMFCRFDKNWKKLPRSSKLYKAACVARGARTHHGHHITAALFVGRAFRCKLETSGNGPSAYSVVAQITEALTGAQ